MLYWDNNYTANMAKKAASEAAAKNKCKITRKPEPKEGNYVPSSNSGSGCVVTFHKSVDWKKRNMVDRYEKLQSEMK